MIVDTSALIAILRDEPGGENLYERILTARNPRMSAGSAIEAGLIAERYDVSPQLKRLIDATGIEIVPVDARQVELAADGFRRFGKGRHAAGLNFGDLFAYALARAYQEPLLYVGDDFSQTDVERA